MSRVLRVALIASARHPISEPFAGGLEAHVFNLARGLARRGHQVALYAAPGSRATAGVTVRDLEVPVVSEAARRDSSMSTDADVHNHYAYLRLMLELISDPSRYDIVHNHSLHYLPVAMAESLRTPVVTTLHTPPTPWLECGIQARNKNAGRFVAVSEHTAAAWKHIIQDATVVPNGIDLDRFPIGPGGGPPVWFGRITPEKGPHLALQAARLAGGQLRLAGPISDPDYFLSDVKPLLDDDRRYLGHLSHVELADVVGRASCALVTPVWEEPYGLVVAEALACGTPVCAFSRGAIPELVDASCGQLVEPDDVAALGDAMHQVGKLCRTAARRRASSHASLELMLNRYERLYDDTIEPA